MSSSADIPAFRFRRGGKTTRFDWLVVTAAGAVAGIEHDPAFAGSESRWRGRYLKPSMTFRWAKGRTRAEVARLMLGLPEIYQ